MTEHRYLNNAHSFDDGLVAELKEHKEQSALLHEEKRAEREAAEAGGLDAIAAGTPLDKVKAIIEKKKTPAVQVLKEHEAGKKMASMATRGPRAVYAFLDNKG